MTGPLEIRAVPHPGGNRIVLEWVHPDPDASPGIHIVRCQRTYPDRPVPLTDANLVVETLDPPFRLDALGRRVYHWTDTGLASETVFYYMLFPLDGDPPEYVVDVRHRAAAMATGPYDYAGYMASLLPAIYHRYDTARGLPEDPKQELAPEDREKGPLRRFLEITGSHLDQLHSMARSVRTLHDLERVDGRLLPLLASWIGWPTDHRREIQVRRSEIRKAPHIYPTIGIVPAVETTIKRVLGWESRTKEFAHNVVLSNRPERLNLWLAEHEPEKPWTLPTKPLSLNYAYDGRPAAVFDGDGKLWLFFHTQRRRSRVTLVDGQGTHRRGQWDVWYKTLEEDDWTASQPLTDSPGIDKHPSAAVQQTPLGTNLWVFWNSWSASDRAWHLSYRTLGQGDWTLWRRLWDDGTERRRPQAVADGEGRLWLFWQERVAGTWRVRYNRHDGSGWELPPANAGRLGSSVEEDPRAGEDLFVLFDPTPHLWVFWARRAGSPQGRWRIAYKVKPDLDLEASNWSEVHELPTDAPEASDREPAAVINAAGDPELYWSSNRDRSWSLWRTVLPFAIEGESSGAPEKLTGNPYSQRAPLAVSGAAGTLLFYYSNERLASDSEIYPATRTVDGRHAGSTTVDARNVAKTSLRGSFDDFQTYTFDTGVGGQRGDENWYAHDTVGLYLTPASDDPSIIARERNVIASALRQFLPVQVRAVLIIELATYRDPVYSYDFPDVEPQRKIGERFMDTLLEDPLTEIYEGPSEESTDRVPDWVWIYSWGPNTKHHHCVDFTADPIDTSLRTWHVGVEPGEES